MGIYLNKEIADSTVIGIWEITEDIPWFIARLQHSENYLKNLQSNKSEQRILHILCTQYLLRNLLPEKNEINICYNKNGKPYLNGDECNISITHSGKMVALLLSKTHEVGIDIERINPRIERISRKFINDDEMNFVDKSSEDHKLEHKHVIWGAKESLFKLYGKGNLHFKENLLVQPFKYSNKGSFEAIISKRNIRTLYTLYYEKIKEYVLVYVFHKR